MRTNDAKERADRRNSIEMDVYDTEEGKCEIICSKM